MTEQQKTIFEQPFYYIGFSISDSNGKECMFQTLFSNEQGTFKYFIEREIHGIRYAGWELPRHEQYTIQLGGLEFKNEKERIKILENGHIVIQGAVSESFLCWANSSQRSTTKGDRIQINATALVEFTYNCVALIKRALLDCNDPQKIACEFGFVGMNENYVLGDAKLAGKASFIINFNFKPISGKAEAKIEFNASDVVGDEGVAKTTYSILAVVYRMFGFSEDIISYTNANEKKIDINLVKLS